MNTFKISIEGMEDIIIADEFITFMYNCAAQSPTIAGTKATFSIMAILSKANQESVDKLIECYNTINSVIAGKHTSISILGSQNQYLTLVNNTIAVGTNLVAGVETDTYFRFEIYLA